MLHRQTREAREERRARLAVTKGESDDEASPSRALTDDE
jgi:hypothetical protein